MKSINYIVIIFIVTLTCSCQNNIQTTEDSIILRDVYGKRIVVSDSAKVELIQHLQAKDIYNNDDLWIFIDENFYTEFEFYKNDTTSYMNEDLILLWFNTDESEEKRFRKEYKKRGMVVFGEMFWKLIITYDPLKNKVLAAEYQF